MAKWLFTVLSVHIKMILLHLNYPKLTQQALQLMWDVGVVYLQEMAHIGYWRVGAKLAKLRTHVGSCDNPPLI